MIRTVEIFNSIQGEGYYLGVPSIFVRLFGCNFTCWGFNSDSTNKAIPGIAKQSNLDADKMQTVLKGPPESALSVADLDGDSFTVGCDSRYSWDPRFKHLSVNWEIDRLAEEINRRSAQSGISHLIFTGGEPLLWGKQLGELLSRLSMDILHITFETNASVLVHEDLAESIRDFCEIRFSRIGPGTVLFSNSPKLAHSGEPLDKRLNPEAFKSQKLGHPQIIQTCKYVVDGSDEQFIEAQDMHHKLIEALDMRHRLIPPPGRWSQIQSKFRAYAMPLGATVEQYQSRLALVAEGCMRYGFTLSPRLHLSLYGNRVGT